MDDWAEKSDDEDEEDEDEEDGDKEEKKGTKYYRSPFSFCEFILSCL